MRTSTSLQIRLNSTTLSRKPSTRRAWRCLLFLCKYIFLVRDMEPKTGFASVPSSYRLLRSKKVENCAPPKDQTAREAMRLFSWFVFSAPFWFSWDSSHFIFVAEANNFSPGWSPSCSRDVCPWSYSQSLFMNCPLEFSVCTHFNICAAFKSFECHSVQRRNERLPRLLCVVRFYKMVPVLRTCGKFRGFLSSIFF